MPKFARRVFDRVRMADMMTARFANRAGFFMVLALAVTMQRRWNISSKVSHRWALTQGLGYFVWRSPQAEGGGAIKNGTFQLGHFYSSSAPWSEWDKTRGTFFPSKFCATHVSPVCVWHCTALVRTRKTYSAGKLFHRTEFGKPSVTFYSKVPEFRCSLDVN